MAQEPEPVSPFVVRAADKLAMAVNRLVKRGVLDSRSEAADDLLNYASIRFGDENPIGDLEDKVQEYENARPPQHR